MGRLFDALTMRAVVWMAGAVVLVLLVLLGLVWLGERSAERNLTDMTAERDGMVTWGDKICGVVGEPFKVPERKEWGRNCFAQVVRLQAFRNTATDQTNKELVGHLKTQLQKSQADLSRAQRDKRLAFEALDALAQEAAHVPETNHVGPGYYGALNRTAGLRDAPISDPGG